VKALLTIAATLGVSATLAAPAGSNGWVTQRYHAAETWSAFADVGQRNPGRGGPADIYVSQLRLTTLDGTKVGVVNGYIVDLRAPMLYSHWTASLPDGTLTLEGATSEAPGRGPQRYAIVGGSGVYEGSHGTVTASDAGKDGVLVVVRYRS
jgi:Allene oxide cyclase barrel like domain